MFKKIALFTLLASSAFFVRANDTAGQLLPTGEIKFAQQPAVVLLHEALVLSDKIAVDYIFRNTSKKEITEMVFFPLPNTSPIGTYRDTPHSFEFHAWSNGVPISTHINRNITLNGTLVTKYFDLMGIDSYDKQIQLDTEGNGKLLEDIAAPLRKLPKEEQEKLVQLGMLEKGCIEEGENGKCAHNPNLLHLNPNADYKQEVSFYWFQIFYANKSVHIRHEYKPSFFSNSIGQPEASQAIGWEYEKPHERWKSAAYIVTTANNWQTPIKNFNLLVLGEKGAAVSAYKDGQISDTKVAPKNYLLETKQDFVPSSEILFEVAGEMDPQQKLPRMYCLSNKTKVSQTPKGKKIATLKEGECVWGLPSKDEIGWFTIWLDENTTGFIHAKNIMPLRLLYFK